VSDEVKLGLRNSEVMELQHRLQNKSSEKDTILLILGSHKLSLKTGGRGRSVRGRRQGRREAETGLRRTKTHRALSQHNPNSEHVFLVVEVFPVLGDCYEVLLKH